ncbi:peptidase M1 [Thioalkalivibrio denitrificans]|uniref:Peptidase M1 n=1 Tax=Thioalkalivibrio denitrificans TaxID=108003 RepID=A0A1V3NN00_9GAMM|nr:M1 family aminopeptidase [Thioalkalivibrio denitrificans]OOG26430.1 peptidase M1 [Thioalkalivibrio denitrificans]
MTPIHLLVTLLAALMAASAIAGPGPGSPDVPEKFLELTIDPAERTIRGELRMHRPPGTSEFRLWDGLRVHEVRAGEETLRATPAPGGRYRIQVPEAAAPVVITWSGALPAPGDGVAGMFMARDGGFLSPEGGWYPVFEPAHSFALRLHARVPSGQRFVATGSLVGEATDDGTHYTARHAHPRIDGVVLVTGPWLERSVEVDGVHVRTLFPEALNANYAESYLEHTARYLGMFAERAGAYPYESFTIAASPAPVGVAFPGFTVLGERVIPLPFIPRTSLAHELLHSWWGTGVRVDYASGNWSEALTTYMADYHLADLRGEGRETRHRWLLDLAALPPEMDRPLVTFRGGNQGADRIIGYNRGAMMFHMLNRRIGAQAFDAGARLFSERHMFRVADWADLQAAFSEAADEDLSSFFNAWLQRPGLPELALHDVERIRDGDAWEIRGVLEQVQEADPWPLAVPLVVETGNGPVRHTVSMDERRASFSVRVTDPPVAIATDPDYDVLRQLADAPPIVRMATLHPDTRLVTTQPGLEGVGPAVLGRRPESADSFAPDASLLLVGETGDVADWLAAEDVPEPPESMARRGRARAWTVPGTRLLVLSADDMEGLRNLVGALRHHGHRSYLVQDADGRSVEAGVWKSVEEPLRAVFRE